LASELKALAIYRRLEFKWGLHKNRYITFGALRNTLLVTHTRMYILESSGVVARICLDTSTPEKLYEYMQSEQVLFLRSVKNALFFLMTIGQVISRRFSNLSHSYLSCAANTSDTLQAGRPEICSQQRGMLFFRTMCTPACGSTGHLSHLLLWIKRPSCRTGHRSPSSDENKDA